MATAVNAFKFENNGQQSLGKLGLAIIGKQVNPVGVWKCYFPPL